MDEAALENAARVVRDAEALIITAGAGMGVDSGLPDFRGDEGFWNAYPPYRKLGFGFIEMANPAHFGADPAFAWGFYGHRLQLYRDTQPHAGFALLQEWIRQRSLAHFVVTSNVDGQFQKAGFDAGRVYEVHGSIHHLQCLNGCGSGIWENRAQPRIDAETMRASDLPRCDACGEVARPNILMFGDCGWDGARTGRQQTRFEAFLREVGGSPLAVIELGAGTGVPTIRHLTEQLARRPACRAVRINPRESRIPGPGISIAMGAGAALRALDRILR